MVLNHLKKNWWQTIKELKDNYDWFKKLYFDEWLTSKNDDYLFVTPAEKMIVDLSNNFRHKQKNLENNLSLLNNNMIDSILIIDDEDLFHLVFEDACSLLDIALSLQALTSSD